MTRLDIDTRTDVYSLGMMLYELLVGALPFDPKELRKAGFDEIRRKIREDEPSKPSTRLTTLGEASIESAKRRRVDVPTLRRQLRGDLDWITLRALDKDRTRRYGSPADLAEDVMRYLNDEPVQASPPSTTYRAKKFIRRHKLWVAAALLVAITLATGIAGILIGFVKATRAERSAKLEAERSRKLTAEIARVMSDVSNLLVAEDFLIDADGWVHVLMRTGGYTSHIDGLVEVVEKLEPVSDNQQERQFILSEPILRDFIARFAVIYERIGQTEQANRFRERAMSMGDPHRNVFLWYERWDWKQVYGWAMRCASYGENDKAVRWLRKLKELGILGDLERNLPEDFPTLAGDPEFEAIVAAIK